MTPIFTVAWAQTGPVAKSNRLAMKTDLLHAPLFIRCFIADSSRDISLADPGRWHFLAPQSQRLLYRAVGKAEQYRVVAGVMRDLAPRRHHENVVRRPRERMAANDAATASFDDAIHGPVGGAIRHTFET